MHAAAAIVRVCELCLCLFLAAAVFFRRFVRILVAFFFLYLYLFIWPIQSDDCVPVDGKIIIIMKIKNTETAPLIYTHFVYTYRV